MGFPRAVDAAEGGMPALHSTWAGGTQVVFGQVGESAVVICWEFLFAQVGVVSIFLALMA